jgi:hypothetical protein
LHPVAAQTDNSVGLIWAIEGHALCKPRLLKVDGAQFSAATRFAKARVAANGLHTVILAIVRVDNATDSSGQGSRNAAFG